MARLVGLALVLAGATVFADPAPAPTPPPAPAPTKVEPARDTKQPLRLVRITPDGKAALILDKNRNRSVLVEVGDGLAGYIVETIEDDAVTLVHKNGTQLVLATAAPAPAAPSGKPESGTATKAPQDPYAPPVAPADPYAPPAAPADPYTPPAAPADPYAPPPGTGPVTSPTSIPTPISAPAPRVVSAPATPGAPPVVSAAPTMPPPASAAPTTPVAPVATPPAPTPPAPAAAPVIGADGKIELKKVDVDAALRDFGALAGAITATFTTGGLKVDRVAAGSLFARGGLRAGDLVVSVEGKPLRTLDDAADLYARAATLRAVSLQVVRGGQPVSVQIAIR